MHSPPYAKTGFQFPHHWWVTVHAMMNTGRPPSGKESLSPAVMYGWTRAKCWQLWSSGTLQDKMHFLKVRLLLLLS